MANELDAKQTSDLLKQKLTEQDTLRVRFEAASEAEDYKDEIDLSQPYKEVTKFRMDTTAFLVEHTPTTLLNQWSVMTGPRRLKSSIESWVDEIQTTFPPAKVG